METENHHPFYEEQGRQNASMAFGMEASAGCCCCQAPGALRFTLSFLLCEHHKSVLLPSLGSATLHWEQPPRADSELPNSSSSAAAILTPLAARSIITQWAKQRGFLLLLKLQTSIIGRRNRPCVQHSTGYQSTAKSLPSFQHPQQPHSMTSRHLCSTLHHGCKGRLKYGPD